MSSFTGKVRRRVLLISNLGPLGSFHGSEPLRYGKKVEMASSIKKYILKLRFG